MQRRARSFCWTSSTLKIGVYGTSDGALLGRLAVRLLVSLTKLLIQQARSCLSALLADMIVGRVPHPLQHGQRAVCEEAL